MTSTIIVAGFIIVWFATAHFVPEMAESFLKRREIKKEYNRALNNS